jgi:hypothetical protein
MIKLTYNDPKILAYIIRLLLDTWEKECDRTSQGNERVKLCIAALSG